MAKYHYRRTYTERACPPCPTPQRCCGKCGKKDCTCTDAGAAIGGASGAGIGFLLGGPIGALIGFFAGGATGAGIGSTMDD
ncbi:MAG TPA: hypothetical protein VD866_17705 [Urbifossiella sp.]|nr:hypothetical protein [Urbifossiella sp.]